MKRVEFTSIPRRWDMYKAFHIHTGRGFVQFETGEIICTRNKYDPQERGYHKPHEVYVVHPDDGVLEFMTDEGEPIPTAQLTKDGNPVLLFDPQFGRAVRLGYRWNARNDDKALPEHLRGYTVLSYSESDMPRGSMKIKVSSPFVATKEHKQWLKEAQEYAKVMYEMLREGQSFWTGSEKALVQATGLIPNLTPTEFIDSVCGTKAHDAMVFLGRASANGMAFARAEKEVDSIKAKLKG